MELTQFDKNPNIQNRLLERKKRIIDANTEIIRGKNVLDLAANNGRWSYAAAKAGAQSVTSIEGRAEKVAEAQSIFRSNKLEGLISAHHGDMYSWLYDNRTKQYDTVFCLGVFYHVTDHYHLLKLIDNLRPNHIIIDSAFIRSFRNMVHIQTEDPTLHRNALPVHDLQTIELVGFISLGMLIQLSWNLGYNCRPISWNPKNVEFKTSVQDYMMGQRYTVLLEKTNSVIDEEWQNYWRRELTQLNPKFQLLFDKSTHDSVSQEHQRLFLKHQKFTIM